MVNGNGKWVLISDACRTRIFADHGMRSGLVELEGYACPAAREHIKDQVSDRAGLKPAGGQGVRSGAAQEVDPKEAEARAYARFLASTLKKKYDEHAFTDLVIAAPPRFLGMLRGAMDESLAKHVVASFDKDYTTLSIKELNERLHAGAVH